MEVLFCWLTFMFGVFYADCRKQTPYAECRYAECHYAECISAAFTGLQGLYSEHYIFLVTYECYVAKENTLAYWAH